MGGAPLLLKHPNRKAFGDEPTNEHPQRTARALLVEPGIGKARTSGWTRQAVGQQHNNNTPATYVLEVRRAVAQLLLVNRAGRELLHLSTWFPNPSTERDGSS